MVRIICKCTFQLALQTESATETTKVLVKRPLARGAQARTVTSNSWRRGQMLPLQLLHIPEIHNESYQHVISDIN